MRSFIISLVLVGLTGCGADIYVTNNYYTTEAEESDDTGVAEDSDMPVDTDILDTGDSDVPVDTDVVDTGSPCHTFAGYDTNGDMVVTDAWPEVRVSTVQDYSNGINAGDELQLMVEVSAQNGCGAFDMREFAIQVYDGSPQAVWLRDLWQDNKGLSELSVVSSSSNAQFPDASMNTYGFGLNNGQIVDGGTSYVWSAPSSFMQPQNGNYIVSIGAQTVTGGDSNVYTFVWDGVDHMPVGEPVEFTVQFGWNDSSGSQMPSEDWDSLTLVRAQ